MTTAVARQITAIRKSAEKMIAAEPAVIGTASAGDVVRQGDLYFVCLKSEPPGKPLKNRQLAPGSTQGSRHVAEGECDVIEVDARLMVDEIKSLVRGSVPEPELIGPAIICRGDVTITHPEHGHRTLPAGSSWGCVFQRAHAEEVRRVRD